MPRADAKAVAQRLAAVRMLVGVYAWTYLLIQSSRVWTMASFDASRFSPVGVFDWLHPSMPSPALTLSIWGIACASGLAFVGGLRFRASGPIFALAMLWITTFVNSWGHVGHGDNLMVLHLMVLGLSPAAQAWSLDARAGRTREPLASTRPLEIMMWIALLTYCVAGIAKLRLGGWAWLDGSVLGDQVARDTLRKELLGAPVSPVAKAFVASSWLHAPLAWFTLVLELGAPLVVLTALGSRMRLAWVAGMWGLHAGILAIMSIGFTYPLCGVAFACFFRTERLVEFVRARRSNTHGMRRG